METWEQHEYWVPHIVPQEPVSLMAMADEPPPDPSTYPPPEPSHDYTGGSFWVAVDIRTKTRAELAETWDAQHPLPIPETP